MGVGRAGKQAGAIKLWLLIAGVAVLGAAAYWFLACPCERVPGGYLMGADHAAPVPNWTFANEAAQCELQVQGGLLPHSITLNCMADPAGALYVSCSRCEGKYWSGLAMASPDARIRIADTVYPVSLRRVLDGSERDRAWRARAAKTGRGDDAPPPDHWWTFALTSRLDA